MRPERVQSAAIMRVAVWVFLVFLPLYVLATRGHFQATDEIAVFQQARSLWERGDVNVARMLNTRVGRDGNYYSAYGIGQSIAAAPFYGAGKWLHAAIADHPDWVETLAGPVVSFNREVVWGGEVEIFVVALFGAFVTALLCSVFFTFAMHSGASLTSALVGVGLFGTSSYVAGFPSNFFQHSLETLVMFTCFYMLFREARSPSSWRRIAAGALAAFGLVVRIQTAVLLPALSLFLLWNAWQRNRARAGSKLQLLQRISMETAPFFCLVGLGIVAQVLVTNYKFGESTVTGGYAPPSFDASLLTSLFGFTFSPGAGMFVFTPLLLLAPVYWPEFFKTYRAAACCMLGVVASYVFFYSKLEYWHGQWCFGPRYLGATVPFLLLPFASWWRSGTPSWRSVAICLGALGVFVQALHVAVNFSYIYNSEGYTTFKPDFGYLFIPGSSQLAAHYRALMAGDHRVDMWLVNVYRTFGVWRLLAMALPLVVALIVSSWGLRQAVRDCQPVRVTVYPVRRRRLRRARAARLSSPEATEPTAAHGPDAPPCGQWE